MGIVPLGEINRRFQDEQGRLNQVVAAACEQVRFIAAGLPLNLKG
jgi:adenosylcobinamide kinase/adenosylcobinamide-phosphate guanylyltransferase